MNDRAVRAMKEFLEALGLDLQEAGMEKTPERVADMYGFLFSGLGKDTREIWGEPLHAGNGADDIVAIRGIPFYSMCEHHLVPFFGEVGIAYLPSDYGVAGFSKFTRLVELISRRPQLQERMTAQLAEAVANDLQAQGVLVVVEAQQLCMTMRGDGAQGARTMTDAALGRLREEPGLREQAMALLMHKVK